MQQEAGWDDFLSSVPLDDISQEKLRQRFTPEVIVPETMTVRPITDRRRKAGLTDYLLDYDQELAVKSDLDLPDEGQGVSSDFRLNIINGVAGQRQDPDPVISPASSVSKFSEETLPGSDPQPTVEF